MHSEVLCTQVLQEAHSGLLQEVSLWLDPLQGSPREVVEQLIKQHLQLAELSRGNLATMYAIPNDPSYKSLTVEYNDFGILQEYHYSRR